MTYLRSDSQEEEMKEVGRGEKSKQSFFVFPQLSHEPHSENLMINFLVLENILNIYCPVFTNATSSQCRLLKSIAVVLKGAIFR